MAIFHCSIKIINRSGGRTAVASAAYRAGEKLYNDENGLTYDFTRKHGVVYTEIMLPENAPERLRDRSTLWNEVQQIEKRDDAQMAREVEVALPVEFSRMQSIKIVREYIQENFVSKGMIADFALHDKGDGNPHVHIMLTVRGFDKDGNWMQKQKTEFARDKDGNKIPMIDPKTGEQKVRVRKGKGAEKMWVRITVPSNDWNDWTKAEEWRKSWADICNKYLSPEQQIDHRSYKRQAEEQRAQGIDVVEKIPTIHEGVTARKMEKEGKTADRVQINRDIRETNLIIKQRHGILHQIIETILKKARDILERFRGIEKHRDDAGLNRDFEQAGRNGIDHGIHAKGYREQKRDDIEHGRRDIRERSNDLGIERTAGRITAVKRDTERTEQEITDTEQQIGGTDQDIAATNQFLEELRQQMKDKKKAINERLHRLQQRRENTEVNVESRTERGRIEPDTGYRGAEPGSADIDRKSVEPDSRPDETDTETLIRQAESLIDRADAREQSSAAKRADRDSERQRQAAARSKEAERRSSEKAGRSEPEKRRSKGQGFSL